MTMTISDSQIWSCQSSILFNIRANTIQCIILRTGSQKQQMIYQIYIKCHDDKYSPSLQADTKNKIGEGKNSFSTKHRQLLPFRIPEHHYDISKLSHSLHQLNSYVKSNKENNEYLATKILLSHGRQQTRKFLHRTKQLFGDKNQALKKRKLMASPSNAPFHSKQVSPEKQVEKDCVKKTDQYLYFQTFKPDFTIRNQRAPPQFRQQRRKTLGLKEADLKNYESSRRGLPVQPKKAQKKKKVKDFKQLNMKGFAARISATLQSRQKVSTKVLVRLMNLNVKCLGDGSLRKRCV